MDRKVYYYLGTTLVLSKKNSITWALEFHSPPYVLIWTTDPKQVFQYKPRWR
jgi:hypothetical protein